MRRPPFSGWVLAIAAAQLAVLAATSTRYGFHGDELSFIVAGWYPAFGYPDQPPLVLLLAAAIPLPARDGEPAARAGLGRGLRAPFDGVGVDNDEQGPPLLLCAPTASWASLWPGLTHFNRAASGMIGEA